MIDEIKSKPCPFCGAKVEVVKDFEFGFEGYSV